MELPADGHPDRPALNERVIERQILQFVDILRHLGLRISSAEVIDAVKGLQWVNLLDRAQVEAVFVATLAKDEPGQKLLKKAFSSYFTTPEQFQQRINSYVEYQEKRAVEMHEAEQDLSFNWEEWGEDGAKSAELKLNLTDEEKRVYAQLDEENKQRIRDYLKSQFQGNRANSPEQLITNVVRSSLNYWKRKLRQEENNLPIEIDYTGDLDTDSLLHQVEEQVKNEQDLLYEDMQKLADRDLPQVGVMIKRLSRKLATRISRRYRQSKKRKRLDVRRSIRHNMRYGGTLFKLDFKTKKREKPSFLLIADVSGSMAKYASFVLQFVYGLASTVDDIESFVFSEGVERVTPHFRGSQPFDQTMADIINKSKEWGKGTDLLKALREIEGYHRNLLRSDTFVIIVSDTKTLNYANAAVELAEIRKLVKDVVWLNTLPRKQWDETPSVKAFSNSCIMYECNTLAHLERIMSSKMLT